MKNWSPKPKRAETDPEQPEQPKPLPIRFFEIYFRVFWKLCIIGLISGLGVVLGILIAYGAGYLAPAPQYTTLFALIGVALYFIFVLSPYFAGVSYVIRNFSRQEHAWISDIFTIAKKNYRRAVIVGIIDVVLIFMLYFSFAFYSLQTGVMAAFRYIIGMMALLLLWMHYYLYTMLVTFDFGLKALYLNSLMFALSRVLWNILITVIVLFLATLEYSAAMLFLANGDTILVLLMISVLGLGALFYTVGFWTYPTIKTKIIDRILRRRTMLQKGAAAPCEFYALRDLSYLGFEYFEIPLCELEALSAAEFVDFSERFKAFSLRALAGAGFCTEADLAGVEKLLADRRELLERAVNLGISILLMPAPKSFDKQTKQALIAVGEEAARHHMTLCLTSDANSKVYNKIRDLGQSNIKWAVRFAADHAEDKKAWEDGIDQLRYVGLQQPADEAAQRALLERLRDLNYEGGVTLFGDGERTAEELRRFNR